MPLVVVVSLPAEPSQPSARAVLLDACSEALPENGACRSTADAATTSSPPARGLVRWLNDAHTAAFVHVAIGREVRERTLRFLPADPEVERLRAIGFALGTLVPASAAPETTAASAASPPAAAPPPPVSPAASTAAAPVGTDVPMVPAAPTGFMADDASSVLLGLSAGATTGPARKLFPGIEARLAIRIRRVELTIAGGASAERTDGPKLDTSLVWASLGGRLPLWSSPRGRTFLRLEGFTEQLHVEVYTPDRPVHDFRWVPGVQLGADAEIVAIGPVFLTASFSAGARFVEPSFRLKGREAPPLGVLRVQTQLGVGTRF